VRRFVRALVLVGRGFRGEAITLRSAALTYLTLFAWSAAGGGLQRDRPRHRRGAAARPLAELCQFAARHRRRRSISAALTTFTTKATVKTLGAIGFALLLVSVLSLLWNIESAFNHIYSVRKPRSPVQRLLKYWSFLTLDRSSSASPST